MELRSFPRSRCRQEQHLQHASQARVKRSRPSRPRRLRVKTAGAAVSRMSPRTWHMTAERKGKSIQSTQQSADRVPRFSAMRVVIGEHGTGH